MGSIEPSSRGCARVYDIGCGVGLGLVPSSPASSTVHRPGAHQLLGMSRYAGFCQSIRPRSPSISRADALIRPGQDITASSPGRSRRIERPRCPSEPLQFVTVTTRSRCAFWTRGHRLSPLEGAQRSVSQHCDVIDKSRKTGAVSQPSTACEPLRHSMALTAMAAGGVMLKSSRAMVTAQPFQKQLMATQGGGI